MQPRAQHRRGPGRRPLHHQRLVLRRRRLQRPAAAAERPGVPRAEPGAGAVLHPPPVEPGQHAEGAVRLAPPPLVGHVLERRPGRPARVPVGRAARGPGREPRRRRGVHHRVRGPAAAAAAGSTGDARVHGVAGGVRGRRQRRLRLASRDPERRDAAAGRRDCPPVHLRRLSAGAARARRDALAAGRHMDPLKWWRPRAERRMAKAHGEGRGPMAVAAACGNDFRVAFLI